MKLFWPVILLSGATAWTPIARPASPDPVSATAIGCAFDRGVLLKQDLETFDQSSIGVRSIYAKRQDCKRDAADLIRSYRLAHPDALKDFNSYLLFWHEGQLRAEIGDYDAATPLFQSARMHSDGGPEVSIIWNLYVDATVAFVNRDRIALGISRDSLATVPRNVFPGARQPPNLDVVDGLIACFDRSYTEAYYTCKKKAVSADTPR